MNIGSRRYYVEVGIGRRKVGVAHGAIRTSRERYVVGRHRRNRKAGGAAVALRAVASSRVAGISNRIAGRHVLRTGVETCIGGTRSFYCGNSRVLGHTQPVHARFMAGAASTGNTRVNLRPG